VSTTSPLPATARGPQGRRVTGILPPIPTPFLDGRVDLNSLRSMLDHLFESIDGVLVGGSTGEAPSLSLVEREQVVRAVAAHLAGTDRAVVVSVADNSLENSRRLSEIAGEVGADLLIVSCPSYYPNDYGMIEAYFAAIAEFASADLCLYDNPYVSKTWLTADEVVALATGVPRVTHVKMTDTSVGKVAAVRAGSGVVVHAGEDSVLWHHLGAGVEGVMSAIPLIQPEAVARMWRSHIAGRRDDAFTEYCGLAPFISAAIHGDDYVSVVKTVLASRGAIASPEVRLPLLPIREHRQAEVLGFLEVTGT
jgi:4-hydroxy-tetrahydrodipicolinate synthase